MERYRVGDLVVDVSAGTVSRVGQPIPLPPLTFNLLVALVRRAPRFMRREELLAAVWPAEYVSDDTLSQRVSLLRRALGDSPGEPRYIASVRRWGYKLAASVETVPEADEPIQALAVLPLQNLTGDAEQDYLADGLTDALLTSLSKLRALRVISRTSVMRYRSTEKPLLRIAQDLGVQALVEGSVLRAGDRVWITAQLVRATTDDHIWSESYQRDVGDVPALLDEVAATIADSICVTVSADERKRLQWRGRTDPIAYDAFLRGSYFLGKYTPEYIRRAISQFDAAIVRDPALALAHAYLAAAYLACALPFGIGLPAAEQHRLMALGKAAAERAVQIDGQLAVGYAALGAVALWHDWDWRRARDMLDRAIHLEPSCAAAHRARAYLGACLMEVDVARCETERAIDLDPLNLGQRAEAAEIRYWVRDYDEAIRICLETIAFDPAFPRAHFVLGRVYEAQGRIADAIRHYRKAGMLTPAAARAARSAFMRGGVPGFHRWALRASLGAQGGPRAGSGAPLRSIMRARLFCLAGHLDEALECLEQAYAERDHLLPLLKVDVFDPLRADPRFQELVRRVGIP